MLGGAHPIVVDTGNRVGRYERGMHVFTRSPEQALAAALAPHGLEPEDVGMLVMTHLHADHTGKIDALPDARIAVQRRELAHSAAPYFPVAVYARQDIAKLVDPLFERGQPLDGDGEPAVGVRVSTPAGTPRLGAHIVGAKATDLIQELVNTKSLEGGYPEVARIIHGHPTMSEALAEAARAADGWLIHG